MAEERNLGTARAPESVGDDDATKEELQRRMEEARESISHTVNEIKETVTQQYQNVRETISQSLDWREQYRRRPVAFSMGAAGVGLLVGYSVGGAIFGDSDDLVERYYEAEGEDGDGYNLTGEGRRGGRDLEQSGYAEQAIAGGAYGSTAYASAAPAMPAAPAGYGQGAPGRMQSEATQAYGGGSSAADFGTPDSRPSYSSGYQSSPAATAEESEPKGPGLFERFKETQAYDRLQQEISTLGNRAVEELSKTARTVVLPALLNKLKDMIGLDLGTQREVAERSRLEQQAAHAQQNTGSAGAGARTSGAGGASGQAGGAGYGV